MKERKMSSDISTAVISVFLSMLLILFTLFSAVYFTYRDTVTPKKLADIVSGMGAPQLVKDYPAVAKALKQYGFEGEKAQKFLESAAVDDLFKLYSIDMAAFLSGDTEQGPALTAVNVSAVMVNHLDELVTIAAAGVTDQTQVLAIESQMVKQIRDGSGDFVKSLPTAKELCKSVDKSGYGELLVNLTQPAISAFLILLLLVLCLAIYTLRYYRFGGFLWLGTDFAVACVGCIILTVLFATGFAEYLISMVIDKQPVIDAAADIAVNGMIIACVIAALLCALCFILYGICKKHFYQKRTHKI